MKNKYNSSHATSVKKMEDAIAAEKDLATALQTQSADAGTVVPAGSSGPATPASGPTRTLATPEFEGAAVPNFDRTVDFEEKHMADFTSSQTLLSKTSG